MRTITITLLLFLAKAAVAAEHPWRVSVLASEISNESSHPWDDGNVRAGIGVAVSYAPRETWDVELSVAAQSHRALYTRVVPLPNGPGSGESTLVPVSEYRRFDVRPIELTASRRFFAEQRLSPYIRAGVRYVDAPDDPQNIVVTPLIGINPVGWGFGFSDRTSVEAGAGLRLRLTDRTYLRADVMRLLRSDAATFDRLTRGTAGVSWKF